MAHKYVKRTGSPGNYKYWYKQPDGSLVSSDDEGSPKSTKQAQIEHLRRLVQAKKKHGQHNMKNAEMLAHVGLTKEDLAEAGVKRLMSNAAAHGPQYEEHETATAHNEEGGDKTSGEAAVPAARRELMDRARRIREESEGGGRKKKAKKKASRRRATEARAEAADASASRTARKKKKKASKKKATRRSAPAETSIDAISDEGLNELQSKFGFSDKHKAFIKKWAGRNNMNMSIVDGKIKMASAYFVAKQKQSLTDVGLSASDLNVISESREGGGYYVTELPFERQAAEAAAGPAPQGFSEEQWSGMSAEQRTKAKAALETLASAGIDLGGPAAAETPTAAPVAQQSRRAATQASQAARTRRNAEAAPTSASARAASSGDPALGRTDEHIQKMVDLRAAGQNPYLTRGKEIYNKIKGELKPERAEVAKNMLLAIQDATDPSDEAELLQIYKSIPGNERKRTLGWADLEKSTFMTKEEILNNPPVDVEVERMKRGYGQMQFERCKPFLKDAWKQANADAPPPMPTFGDMKPWGQVDGGKPGWAGNTRMAVPKEVFDASVKVDGKPKYPPAWMPIHLMPAWNYACKKSIEAHGEASLADYDHQSSPYKTRSPIGQGGEVAAPVRATRFDGFVLNALRKYVQMRGGQEGQQFTDIPVNKMPEGVNIGDLYKAEADLDRILATKIIDPVAIIPFIDEEIDTMKMKKSFALVVGADKGAVNFKKSYVIDAKKSEMINKIKRLKKSHARA